MESFRTFPVQAPFPGSLRFSMVFSTRIPITVTKRKPSFRVPQTWMITPRQMYDITDGMATRQSP
ncbi:MAG: hypothetical protein VB858_14965, partial [Planctomycetaceae bacterium]